MIVDCPACGGVLKPDIVYFGESVPKERVDEAYSLVDRAGALLVAGSSLTVYSGYRFVRHAAALGIPIAIINRGRTRGDDLAAVKIDNGCSPMLALLADTKHDMLAKIPHGKGQTLLREALILADHNSYHLGQLMFLRKMLEAAK